MMAFVGQSFAGDAAYVGTDKCKVCHKSKKKGNQYGKWLESGHAKAWATLATDEAKAIAKDVTRLPAPCGSISSGGSIP